jgi:hypothetical protein
MATNIYFNQKVKSEQGIYEDIVIESLKMYGQDVYYLPRDIVNRSLLFNDDVPSRFNSAYKIEMYIENVNGFDGEGDLMTKFGVELRDQATFIVSRRRWDQTVKRYDNDINSVRPREGDLIYLTLSNTLFEIMHVEHEQPFYQLSNLPTYKLRCEKFEYNDEKLDTNIETIDSIEQTGYNVNLTLQDSSAKGFIIGNTISQTLSGGVIISGEIVDYNDSSNVISLAHIGASDGLYHEFTTLQVTSLDSDGNTLRRTVTVVNETLNDPGNQNQDFADLADIFVDFTEVNPFGDLETP